MNMDQEISLRRRKNLFGNFCCHPLKNNDIFPFYASPKILSFVYEKINDTFVQRSPQIIKLLLLVLSLT